MPRKRTTTKPLIPRSRAGCDRCRKVKTRCDETRPVCGQCRTRGFADCTVTVVLKWESEFVGRAFGRAGVWSKSKDKSKEQTQREHGAPIPMVSCETLPVQSYGFVNAVVADFESADRSQTGHLDEMVLWRPNFTPVSPRLQLPSFSCSNEVDAQLLSYYLFHLCPQTVPCAGDKSPFSRLVFPYAMSISSPALTQSILCLAACHRAKQNPAFEPMALRYLGKALRSLRMRILSGTNLDPDAHAELLVSMMFLCQSEIIRSCDERWVVHLRGARRLTQLRRSTSGLSNMVASLDQIIGFAERYFAFQDVIGRTACGEEPIFGADFWSAQQDETDPWLGCSPNLVSIISTITEMNWKYHHRLDTGVHSAEYKRELGTLRSRLETLTQQPGNLDDKMEIDLIQASAEAKHLAVQVYFHTALADANPSCSLVKGLIQQILRLAHVLLASDVKAGLTWPLFVAAVQLDKDEELEWIDQATCPTGIPYYARPFILYALDRMSDGLANVRRLRSIIEKVWREREISASAGQGDITSDWARFVSPFCQNMSLA